MAGMRPDLPTLKKALKAAEGAPVAFAYWSTSGEKGGNLLIDRTKKAPALQREAKGQAKGAKIAWGTLRVEGKSVTLSFEADLPKLDMEFRHTLKAIGVDYKVAIRPAQAADVLDETPAPQPALGPEAQPKTPDPQAAKRLTEAAARWDAGRRAAVADLKKLIAAIEATAKQEPALAEAAHAARKLATHFAPLDQTLAGALKRLAATTDPKERRALAEAARKRARAHRSHIASPFFAAVDENGFVATKIRSELSASLDVVDTALGL
jgi:hypothetical protein